MNLQVLETVTCILRGPAVAPVPTKATENPRSLSCSRPQTPGEGWGVVCAARGDKDGQMLRGTFLTTFAILTTHFRAAEDIHLALSGTKYHFVQATVTVNGMASFVFPSFSEMNRGSRRYRQIFKSPRNKAMTRDLLKPMCYKFQSPG